MLVRRDVPGGNGASGGFSAEDPKSLAATHFDTLLYEPRQRLSRMKLHSSLRSMRTEA